MLKQKMEVTFAIVGALWLSSSLISSFNSYRYLKKNLGSISNLLFGDTKHFSKLDLSSFFLIETTIGMIEALRFRELIVLKKKQIFVDQQFFLAPNLDDKKLKVLLMEHGIWYKKVIKNLVYSCFCMLILGGIYLFLRY